MIPIVTRIMIASQIKRGKEAGFLEYLQPGVTAFRETLASRGVKLASVFRKERLLLVYAEIDRGDPGENKFVFWSDEIRGMLEPWPGFSQDLYEFRLNDVFHDDEPSEDAPWRNAEYKPERHVGSLAQLKPEHYASYVFLHYQLQEERPRQFNKYYMIGSVGPYLFSYQELPAVREAPRKGLLSTRHSPVDWHGSMLPHFEPWMDTDGNERLWRALEEVFSWELRTG